MAEWAAYEAIEPPVEVRIDLGFATLAAMLANIHRDRKRRPEPFTAQDFLPKWDREPTAAGRAKDKAEAARSKFVTIFGGQPPPRRSKKQRREAL